MLYNISFKEMKQNCINIFKENKLDINTITNQDIFKSFVWYWTVYNLLIKHSKEEEIDYNDINIENKKEVEEDKNEKKEVIEDKKDNEKEIIENNEKEIIENNEEFTEDNKEEIIEEKRKKLNTKDAEKIYSILWNKKNLYIFDEDDNIINVDDDGTINTTFFSAFMFEFINNNMVLISIDENLFNKFYISACKYANISYNLYNEVDPFKEEEEMFNDLINEDKGIIIRKDNFDQFIPNLSNQYDYDDYDNYNDYYNDEDNYENEDNYEDDNLDYY